MHDVPDAPYGNFFGDDFFTLLHHSAGPCVASLREVKASLKMVIDHEQSRHLRAQAAVTLGRFVQDRHQDGDGMSGMRSEEHTSELQSLMRISYAVFCLKKKKKNSANK